MGFNSKQVYGGNRLKAEDMENKPPAVLTILHRVEAPTKPISDSPEGIRGEFTSKNLMQDGRRWAIMESLSFHRSLSE